MWKILLPILKKKRTEYICIFETVSTFFKLTINERYRNATQLALSPLNDSITFFTLYRKNFKAILFIPSWKDGLLWIRAWSRRKNRKVGNLISTYVYVGRLEVFISDPFHVRMVIDTNMKHARILSHVEYHANPVYIITLKVPDFKCRYVRVW